MAWCLKILCKTEYFETRGNITYRLSTFYLFWSFTLLSTSEIILWWPVVVDTVLCCHTTGPRHNTSFCHIIQTRSRPGMLSVMTRAKTDTTTTHLNVKVRPFTTVLSRWLQPQVKSNVTALIQIFQEISNINKSAKWHCGRHTLICKKILIKKTWLTMIYEWFLSVVSEKKI